MPRDSSELSRSASPRPLRRHSQNFLVDTSVARRIVAAFEPREGDIVLEVGPGRGALTELLIGRVERFQAIEIDRRLGNDLRTRFPALELFERDVLSVPLAGAPHPASDIRVISNLPYGISSPFLLKLIQEREALRDVLLLLQREVVDRLVATPGNKAYGSLSVVVQLAFALTPLFTVHPAAFSPPPDVVSRLLRLVPLAPSPLVDDDEQRLRRVLRAGFGQRRKVLAKTLSVALELDRSKIEHALVALGHDAKTRPERLSPHDWLQLARMVPDFEPSEA